MRAADVASLMLGLGMIVVYFALILPGLGALPTSPPMVAIYWVVVAVFIAPPMAKILSERVLGSVFGGSAGKITKEYSKAKSLAAQGRFEEAIEEYRRGLEREPDNLMLRLEIAELYSGEMKDFRRAISELEECLKLRLGPTQGASVLNRMADIYETNLADTEAATAALRGIQERWPGTKLAERARERMKSMGQETENSG